MNVEKPHDSMRGHFAYHLYEEMDKNHDIYVIVCDLGYGMFDPIRNDFSDRFINVGASEQAGMGIACGLALNGKIPFIYSITPFLIYRAFETIRNYVNHEEIPVKLIGSGYHQDYEEDGFSHWCDEIEEVMKIFDNIAEYYPTTNVRMKTLVPEIVNNNVPTFICLRR